MEHELDFASTLPDRSPDAISISRKQEANNQCSIQNYIEVPKYYQYAHK
jgi:hypothetical protein